ncbi:hypothetical protein V1281_005493 [Nitrobacteraceae bacterium AZCC 2161]
MSARKFTREHIVLGIALVIGVAIFASLKTEEAKSATCASKCSDNEDLIKNFIPHFTIIGVKIKCIAAAEKAAKYGTPKFPSPGSSFGSFYKGDQYTKTGSVILVEPDAQFSNTFGGMVHSTVTCTYNLDQTTVSDIVVTPH